VSLPCQQELNTQGVVGVPTGTNPEDSNGGHSIVLFCLAVMIDIFFLLELWEVESIMGPRDTAAMYCTCPG
jgi:hypothetical protein